mgnify:FL=1|tara:strand:- start:936 stop:1955 length:1020 start_codon:yes stop_codon:yes gene_type:complete
MKKYDVAVVGATGAVGQAMIKILEQRQFPVGNVHLLASSRSAGSTLKFAGKDIVIEDLAEFDFSKVQIGLFSAGGDISAEFAPKAAAAGCIVIDNTSHFRMDKDIPLVVPEVNPEAIADYKNRGIIANPNCSTIQMLVALAPIHAAVGIERINVATYQAVSGTGAPAIEELKAQSKAILEGEETEAKVYPKQIAFNVLPHIDVFQENGYTKEEMKMVLETKKILGDEAVLVNPTCVRVPVIYGHSEALHIETKKPLTPAEATAILAKAPGVKVLDEQKDGGYATPAIESEGDDYTWVSRIRQDISHPRGLNLWCVSDNVRKGAALNSIQIAEYLINHYL